MPARSRASEARLVWSLVGVNALLGIYAYRDLLTGRPRSDSALDAESWFFEPSDTSAPIILILVLWLAMRRWRRFRRVDAQPGPLPLTCGLLALGAAVFAWSTWVRKRPAASQNLSSPWRQIPLRRQTCRQRALSLPTPARSSNSQILQKCSPVKFPGVSVRLPAPP